MPDENRLPDGTRQAVPDLDKYKDLSDDELSDIMAGLKDDPTVEPEPDPEPADDGMDDPEPEEKEEESTEEEPSEEEPADESAKDDDEPADDPNPLEKRIQLLERRLELEALQRERETEARKRAEMLASKQAGRAGYLQQQLKDKAKDAPAKSEDTDASDDPWADDDSQSPKETRQEQPAPVQGRQQDDDTRTELVAIAINDEGVKFANEHAAQLEEMPGKFVDRLQDLIREEAAPYAGEFQEASMKTVRKLARSIMNSAYAAARIEFAQEVEREATTREAESVEKSRRRIKKAAISATGRRSAPPKPTNKSYEDMDLDELEAEMKKEFGENYRIGPRNGL
jgi:hypothetical protein